jgi:hypothetical protein
VFEDPNDPVLAQGEFFKIEAARFRGALPAVAFLQNLLEADQRKMAALFDWMAQRGRIDNREKFKKVEDEIFEFKAHQIRMPCYFERNKRVIVTHGTIKKKDDLAQADIDRAKLIKGEFTG